MALLLSTELDSGISGEYWRIGSVVVACVPNPIVTVYMELYLNRTAKYNNKTPLKTIPINMNLSDIDPTFDFDFRACVYNAMSNLSGWTDAKYIYEFEETYEQIPIVNYLEVESDFNGSIQLPAFQGQDLNNLPLSYEIVDQPSNGTIEENNGVYIYTPNSNWFGDEIATYRCYNGTQYSKPAKIFLTVKSDLPVANDVSLECDYNGSAVITFSATDPNNLPLTYQVLSQPTNGTVVEDNGVFTYTPNQNWSGSDSVIYIAKNGTYDSNVANITFTVQSDVPVANNVEFTTSKNTAFELSFNASDPNNLPLNYIIVDQPVNGSIVENSGKFIYTPDNDFVGLDLATYKASNLVYESEEKDITIAVVE